jgi:hypothetical protein
MVTISLHLDPDDLQELAQARGFLDNLNRAAATVPGDESAQTAPSPQPAALPESVAAAGIADLWNRTGTSLRTLVKASAEPDGEFTLGDLAEALGQPPNSIRSRFANLGRSIKAMQQAVPGAPPLYQEAGPRRDGIWYFTMPAAYREVVLRTDVAEPYSDGSLPS